MCILIRTRTSNIPHLTITSITTNPPTKAGTVVTTPVTVTLTPALPPTLMVGMADTIILRIITTRTTTP